MFVQFFYNLKEARIPVTIREFLTFLEALDKGVAQANIDEFYYLARAALVKDERFFDTFDLVFENFFKGAMHKTAGLLDEYIPEEWLQGLAREMFSEDEIDKLSFDELMDELAKRLQEQDAAHHGGSKWIGTGGTSPFGNSGQNPAGVRIGGDGGGKSATKMWQKRDFRSLRGETEIGTRNMKMALRRLRRFVREGAEDEFDLQETIKSTADRGGMLDIKMRAERKNKVKVLTMFDIGGSMDSFIRISEELFSAVRTEFKHLEYYYFHNFLYERVWRQNRRGYNEWTPTWEVMNTYGPDWKAIFVGDATMSPFEITEIGGSIEHWNEEAGELWLRRFLGTYPDAVWLNPVPPARWMSTPSIRMTYQLLEGRMFPLTVDGLDAAMKLLRQGRQSSSRLN
ncbi:MAG: VWA domain-containing protein [Pseudomonadota bacterium]|nr:VWA domain-containing protein [Pseudomonadota bacterium]MEC8726578.1 VWA domain-containing protein [Pseudomonadota bacterium]